MSAEPVCDTCGNWLSFPPEGVCYRCAPAPLTWTREAPTKPGWYWMRQHNAVTGPYVSVVLVYLAGGFLYTEPYDDYSPPPRVSDWRPCEWAGPIPEPLPSEEKRR